MKDHNCIILCLKVTRLGKLLFKLEILSIGLKQLVLSKEMHGFGPEFLFGNM